MPHPRPHRRRDRHHPVRIRRHPALPGRENRPPAAAEPRARWQATQWLIFHAASVGPLIGQRVHFEIFAAHKDPIAIERYRRLTHEAYATLDQHLASGQPHFAGDEYSIADIAHFGWTHIARLIGFDFDAYPHLSDWHERIALRPAVQRGIMLPEPAIGA